MTGRLLFAHPDEPAEPHDRVLFTMGADRQFRYRDQRKLQGLWLADDDAEMDREEFEAALSARRSSIKTVLTNQSVVAGLGNLPADEILWRAKVRPSTHSNDLTEADRRRLYTRMRRTLPAWGVVRRCGARGVSSTSSRG
ncbi:hypothetical protein [Streptomyces regalis]|uniref:Formamidopyrimidine-DNA glycosylase catalytic domain-containing protein n=1 Tax=Streptomyces regalis TaxID=68262 RepID=A0A0X3VJZ9_9ACTN|nr:hypothetical protein [Streptomyces regalis]KUL44944.1 hypothetical protein ADL12_04765 [Streptomyces regalis]